MGMCMSFDNFIIIFIEICVRDMCEIEFIEYLKKNIVCMDIIIYFV